MHIGKNLSVVCSKNSLWHLGWWQHCNLQKTAIFTLIQAWKQCFYDVTCQEMNIGSHIHLPYHIYPIWKTILPIWQNMKASDFQKVPMFQLFSELVKICNYSLSIYSEIPLFNLVHELGKIGKSSKEIAKTWKCSLSSRFKSLNFESIEKFGKVMP